MRFGDPETQALVAADGGRPAAAPRRRGAGAASIPARRRRRRGRRGLRGARLGRLPARVRDRKADHRDRGGRGACPTSSCSTPAPRGRRGAFVTAGGRVLGVTARGADLARRARSRLRGRGAHPLRRLPLPPRHRGPRAPVSALAARAGARGSRTAAPALAAGELLGFPTETVWGLGADRRERAAPSRACARWKGRARRPADRGPRAGPRGPRERSAPSCREPARRLAAAFWPGPLTLVLRCRARFAAGIAGRGGRRRLPLQPAPRRAGARARGASRAGLGAAHRDEPQPERRAAGADARRGAPPSAAARGRAAAPRGHVARRGRRRAEQRRRSLRRPRRGRPRGAICSARASARSAAGGGAP